MNATKQRTRYEATIKGNTNTEDSTMTRKDHRAIAGAIREVYEANHSPLSRGAAIAIINNLINIIRNDNPRFDADGFREACYGEEK